MSVRFYYWLETKASDGCNHWDWALVRGSFDAEGKKNRSTEEKIVFGICEEGDINRDISDCWDSIDDTIRQALGFVPDYEVN